MLVRAFQAIGPYMTFLRDLHLGGPEFRPRRKKLKGYQKKHK
jgi:hypothetical protein